MRIKASLSRWMSWSIQTKIQKIAVKDWILFQGWSWGLWKWCWFESKRIKASSSASSSRVQPWWLLQTENRGLPQVEHLTDLTLSLTDVLLHFRYGGATIFNNETSLHFSEKFLSITISTNQVVYTAVHTMRVRCRNHRCKEVWKFFLLQIRVIMLKTDLLPYDDVADLFIIDPDGFIIRKWNSKQLNNGLMTAEFKVMTCFPN